MTREEIDRAILKGEELRDQLIAFGAFEKAVVVRDLLKLAKAKWLPTHPENET